jgi:hypothetical protein
MAPCTWLDLEALGYQLIMPKNLPGTGGGPLLEVEVNKYENSLNLL